MKCIIEARASTILFNVLLSNKEKFGQGRFLLPANVCPIVPAVFLKAKVPFEFVDISLDTLCIDQNKVLNLVKYDKQIAGLLFVHTYGALQDLDCFFNELVGINSDIFLIDDRCLCIPDITSASSYLSSCLTLYSTGYAKYVEFGEGGFGFINEQTNYKMEKSSYSENAHDDLVMQMNDCIKNGISFQYRNTGWLKFDTEFDLEQYFSSIKCKKREVDRQKSRINEIYTELIPQELQIGAEYNNWRFNIQVDNKDALLDVIFAEGLFASSHYSSISGMFSDLISPNAERFHKSVVNLFNDHRLSIVDAEILCTIINKHHG